MTTTLSIVIPTKDRYECLFVLLRTMLSFERRDFELIIADNSPDNSAWKRFAADVTDPRIRYTHHAAQLPIIDNCDIGLAMAKGDFVCMLGDDDGVAPWILEVADWMAAEGIDALLANRPVYMWPGVTTKVLAASGDGSLSITRPNGRLRPLDVQRELLNVLAIGGTDLGLIPRVYHGLIRRSCLDALRVAAGTCFPGPSPDMANGVGLCRTVKRMVFVDVPVVITGNMPRSGGGMGTRGKHVGQIENLPHLRKDTAAKWTPYIPKFWSGPTIWAESAVQALDVVNAELRGRFNYPYLHAACRMFNREYEEELNAAADALIRDGLWSRAGYRMARGTAFARIVGARATSLVRNLSTRFGVGGNHELRGVTTIADAMRHIDAQYGSMPAPWARRA